MKIGMIIGCLLFLAACADSNSCDGGRVADKVYTPATVRIVPMGVSGVNITTTQTDPPRWILRMQCGEKVREFDVTRDVYEKNGVGDVYRP